MHSLTSITKLHLFSQYNMHNREPKSVAIIKFDIVFSSEEQNVQGTVGNCNGSVFHFTLGPTIAISRTRHSFPETCIYFSLGPRLVSSLQILFSISPYSSSFFFLFSLNTRNVAARTKRYSFFFKLFFHPSFHPIQ